MPISQPQQAFLDVIVPLTRAEDRLAGLVLAGSLVTGGADEYSDVDLMVVVADAHYEPVMAERIALIQSWTSVLAAFQGDHVGEPRLIITLVGPELLHVDFKFIRTSDYRTDSLRQQVLWERQDALAQSAPATDSENVVEQQWIEDRFWVWIHYAVTKLGRGELFDALDMLTYLRSEVFGPLISLRHGRPARGVRRLESFAAPESALLQSTTCSAVRDDVARAIEASVALYILLRRPEEIVRREAAESAVVAYLRAAG